MKRPQRQNERSTPQGRAEHILSTAADLLLRWGYKRVTIDDIAKHAGIGKGTIYLHWKTREALFEALMLQEMGVVVQELLKGMRKDPLEVLPHRMMRSVLLITMGRPLARALFTGDIDLLGKLAGNGIDGALYAQEIFTTTEYFALLREHGLLRNETDQNAQFYAFYAATMGFFLVTPFMPEDYQPPLEVQADKLAQTIRLAFESNTLPAAEAMQEVAAKIIDLFEQSTAKYVPQIQGQNVDS